MNSLVLQLSIVVLATAFPASCQNAHQPADLREGSGLELLLDKAAGRGPYSERERVTAQVEIREKGTNLFPVLIDLLSRNSLTEVEARRASTVAELTGKALRPFQERIAEELYRGTNAYLAAFTLSKVGPEAIPFFKRALTNDMPSVAFAAASFMYVFKDETAVQDCVEGLTKGLDAEFEGHRRLVAGTLGDFGKKAESAIPALLKRLEIEKGTSVKMEIIRTLLRLGYQGADGRRLIERLAADPEEPERVRRLAEHALTKMSSSTEHDL